MKAIILAILFLILSPIPLTTELRAFTAGHEITLSQSEQNWLNAHHTVHVRVGNWPPFMIVNSSFEGISVDYIKRIFALHHIAYEFISDSQVPWKKALQKIRDHQEIDLLLTAKITEERTTYMAFTEPYLKLPWVIFTRFSAPFVGSMGDLSGKTVCVPDGYVMHDLLRKNYPDIKLYVLSGANLAPRCIAALGEGVVDAYIGNLAVGSYVIQRDGITDVKVAAPVAFGTHDQAMAVRDDWPELASIIDKTMKSIPQEEQAAIWNHWLSVRYEHGIRAVEVLKWILGVVCISTFIVMMVLYWNRKLKKEVAQRVETEKSLRESESKYRNLTDASFEAILLLERGLIVEINETFLKMFGYQREGVIGRKATDFVHPEDCHTVLRSIQANREEPYEIRGLRKDGTDFPVEAQGRKLLLDGKEVRLTAIRDLSEKRKAEADLKRLQGIIPICMHCKGIRDKGGEWNKLEKYIAAHSDVQFSHGVCESCLEKYYPDFTDDGEKPTIRSQESHNNV